MTYIEKLGLKNGELLPFSEYLAILAKIEKIEDKNVRLKSATGFIERCGEESVQLLFDTYEILDCYRSFGDIKKRISDILNKDNEKSKKEISHSDKYLATHEKYVKSDKFLGYNETGMEKAKKLGVSYYLRYDYDNDAYLIYTGDMQDTKIDPLYRYNERHISICKKCIQERLEYLNKIEKDEPVVEVIIQTTWLK